MEESRKNIYDYIVEEEANWKTVRIPITSSVNWNMHEHIERCTNVSNGWFHRGKNDGMRPYNDIVTPIFHVAQRSEGFDVKDIVPFVNDSEKAYKSFLIRKFHPQWARAHEIDTFIDELVDSSIVYDLALVKNINEERPAVVPLQQIAFCDQTDVLSGAICLKHQYTIPDMLSFRDKWDKDKINLAILNAKNEKPVAQANDQVAKTPNKYIEVYELHGHFPESWLEDGGSIEEYSPQMHIVCYYIGEDNKKHGITLFKGKEKKPIFKALVIKKVYGRACGRSLIETLFEPQVWTNYDAIRIKEILDAAALILFQTSDEEFRNQKITNLKTNSVLTHADGKPITKMDTTVPNMSAFTNHQIGLENSARTLGSASDAQLGTNPTAGTPFALQNLVVQQGQGIHEYRQGKIATFVADQLYRDWILPFLVKEMNDGKNFSEELSLDELQEIAEIVTTNEINKRIKEKVLSGADVPTEEEVTEMTDLYKSEFLKKGNRRFFEILKDELLKIPIDVYVNIVGKQRYMAQNADRITNIIREVIRNPQAFTQIPGIGKAFNQLIEESGMSPIDFAPMIKAVKVEQPETKTLQPIASQVETEQLQK